MTNHITITKLTHTDQVPYELLLIADPSRNNVDKYISNSSIYSAYDKLQLIGCYVLTEVDRVMIEIKNIVIDENHHGKGFGTLLLKDAISKAKYAVYKKVIIGTGNSSVGQLYLYQKVGFRITSIKADYFKEHYQERIMENGIECRDMIVLTKELE